MVIGVKKKIRKHTISRYIAFVLSVCLCATVTVAAEEGYTQANTSVNRIYSETEENDYWSYQQKNIQIKCADANIDLGGGNFVSSDLLAANEGPYIDSEGNSYDNTVVLKDESVVEYEVDIPSSALYNIEITYLPLSENGSKIEFALLVDGEYPFSESQSNSLPILYKNEDGKKYDDYGNQYTPEQIILEEYTSRKIFDASGCNNFPYCYLLSAGKHKITLKVKGESFVLAKIVLTAPNPMPLYADVSREYNDTDLNSEPIVIEGEDAYAKDTRALVPKSDTSSPAVSPSDAKKQFMNYIGSTNWQDPGEQITWKFSVQEDGLYDLRMIYKQDQIVNGYTYRTLKIDGEYPFKEAESLKFYYGTSWQTYTFADEDDNPYYIYLTKGEHTLSLTATMGDTDSFYRQLKQITTALGDLYLAIAMITGDSPDKNRDYDLFRQIPDFENRLNELYGELSDLADEMRMLSGNNNTSCVSAVNNMARILKSMSENLYTAQNYVTDYYNNYTNVSAWLYDMKAMPLSIDRIYLVPKGSDYSIKMSGFIEKTLFSVKRFLVSFSDEYSGTSLSDKNASVKIWINWGRDQAMVLNSLIQETFTPKTGISVNLEITDATLVKGVLSNNAPDLALYLARTEPVNLAMRGALCDLTQFEDFDEVSRRFGDTAIVPYTYDNGFYALPDSQSFYLMFYRTDVFEALDLEVPESWDDFLAATAVLQRNNMQSWIPYIQITSSTTVNTGIGGLNLFASILQQFGGNLYNEEKNLCMLDSKISLKAFTYWTDMYTKYKLPTTASFYNRFRLGTMPLGIEVYTMYTTLKQAAPEIDGRWSICKVPGIKNEDGTVNHTVAGAGTGCAILSSSEHKDEAWEFLKWWTDADTQLKFSNNVESILGSVSRTTTSNLDAFAKMDWDSDDFEILTAQMAEISEISEVPGSYYVSRSVDQAFWNVVNNNEAPKDSLLEWTEIANSEIKRKIEQYGA